MAGSLPAWMSRGIPDIDARTAALFRIVFGSLTLLFFASRRVDSARLAAVFDPQVEGEVHAGIMRWLASQPLAADLIMPVLFATGAAFTVGFLTRSAYLLFLATAILWAYPAVAFDSTHPHSTLMLTLVALLPSRWGDAWSVDSWLRQSQAPGSSAVPTGKVYGYSVWAPVLVLGVAFLAAAWAKLESSGVSWVLNGSVKYHFITDAAAAPVDWGLQLAGHPSLAVLASFGAMAIEALAITAAFTRSDWYRALIGVGALGLLVGFALFMGVFWPGWWILLIGFLPWQRINRRIAQPAGGGPAAMRHPVSAFQVALIVFVLAQQVVFSALALERAPMFTNYPMYRNTFPSPQAFDASIQPYSRILVTTAAGTVELTCNAGEDLVDEFRAAVAGSADAAMTIWRAVEACRPDLSDVRDATIEQDLRLFDWNRLTFTITRAATVIGPLKKPSVSPASAVSSSPQP